MLSNAIKFSEKDSIVKLNVSICLSDREQDLKNEENIYKLVFSVIDQGIGIKENELRLVFDEQFLTTDNESHKLNPNSNGLGLRISKAIIQNMNGDITVESRYGKGSCFTANLYLKVDS